MPHFTVQRALRLLSASLCLTSAFFISTSLAAVNEWSGQAPFGGNVNAIWPAQGTADKAWAMGTELYVTTDAGSSWSPVEADAGDGLIEANRSILINPNDSSNVHLLTATRLLESNDGGDTWSVAAEYDESVGGFLEYGGTFSTVIYGSSDFGLMRSDDAGQTWTSLTNLRPFSVSFDFAPDPFDPLTAYISASGLYRSSDGGETWQPLTNGLASGSVLAIATDPSSQGTLYAYVRNAGVHKSIDGGDSWQLLPGSPSSFVTEVKVHPLAPARIYVSTLVSDVLVSPDAGLTWQTLPNDGLFGFESEVIAFDTINADRLYLGTEWKGIFTTANGGTNWTRANNGFSAQGVYELSIGPQDGKVFAGLREGVATRERDGNEWTENEGPYSFQVEALVVDPVAPQHAYLGSNCCGIFETFDAGLTWNPVPGLTDDDITGLDIPQSAPKTLWITDSSFGLFGTRDGGETFDNHSAGLAPLFSGTVNLYAVDSVANQPDTLYVGANEGIFLLGADEGDGGIYRSDDGGLTWTRKSGGVLDGPREVYRIAVHP
ncbi:MAG: WD40/YVTN/BNR-like repeat-containing protein, partial [Gammaproteobacteria bacterium]